MTNEMSHRANASESLEIGAGWANGWPINQKDEKPPERLDELFERTAQRQYQRTLLFSSVVELMHSVVLGVEPTVYSAYRKRRHTLKVSDQAVYDKLDGMELALSAAASHGAARRLWSWIPSRWSASGRVGSGLGC